MPKRSLVVVLALVAGLAPGLALAKSGCGHERQAQLSCAQGQSWDQASGKCVNVGS